MQILLSVAVLVLFSSSALGLMDEESINCYRDVMSDCDKLEPRSQSGFPSIEELNNACEAQLLAMSQCIRDLSQKKCSEELTSVMNEIAGVMEDLCDAETELGRGYRDTVDCINNVRDDFYECRIRKYSELENKPELLELLHNTEEEEESDRLHFCNREQITKQCSRHHIRESCGEVAEEVMKKVTEGMDKILMPEPCTDDELKRAEDLLE